jgi:hypothetical protein
MEKLTIEIDAKYIESMLNNPDIQPNTAMNHWIARILLFNFILKHVPGSKHQGPDRLSHRQHAPEDDKEDEEGSNNVEEWIDELLGCGLWVANGLDMGALHMMNQATVLQITETSHISDLGPPSGDASWGHDEELCILNIYLETLTFPAGTSTIQHSHILKQAHQFFTHGTCLIKLLFSDQTTLTSSMKHMTVLIIKDSILLIAQ